MNREIKFRAWNGNNMVDLYSTTKFAIKDGFEMDGLFIPFYKDYTLMQYTGLKDKNGKEIYEGDVISVVYPEKAIGNVWYNPMKCSFVVEWKTDTELNSSLSIRAEICEVIGNIYENPDLIK